MATYTMGSIYSLEKTEKSAHSPDNDCIHGYGKVFVRWNHRADTRFLSYALSQTESSGYLTGSTMPNLTQGNLNRLPVIAPLAEYKAIAAVPGALDDKIESNRRMSMAALWEVLVPEATMPSTRAHLTILQNERSVPVSSLVVPPRGCKKLRCAPSTIASMDRVDTGAGN